jgi:hypothetical protein
LPHHSVHANSTPMGTTHLQVQTHSEYNSSERSCTHPPFDTVPHQQQPTNLVYVSTGMSCTSTSCSRTSSHDTAEHTSMCTLVRVRGKGKPPRSGARMYLLNLCVLGVGESGRRRDCVRVGLAFLLLLLHADCCAKLAWLWLLVVCASLFRLLSACVQALATEGTLT